MEMCVPTYNKGLPFKRLSIMMLILSCFLLDANLAFLTALIAI